VRDAGAVDTESLVVQAGRWVWTVRVDVHILDHGGNLASAASLAVRFCLSCLVVLVRL
jgi:exosome complex component RRP45